MSFLTPAGFVVTVLQLWITVTEDERNCFDIALLLAALVATQVALQLNSCGAETYGVVLVLVPVESAANLAVLAQAQVLLHLNGFETVFFLDGLALTSVEVPADIA